MSNPKVTVLMSVYNGESFLHEAIESITKQTFADFEFIVVDDGSDDGTRAIIEDYAAQDERMVVIRKKNSGLTDSLNVGLSAATGAWIARMDADDVALPDRLEKQLRHLQTRQNIILLGTDCVTIDECGRNLKAYHFPSAHRQLVQHIERGRSPFPHASAMFDRELARQLGGYRVQMRFSQDKDLWLRMSAAGEMACLPESLLKLRKHPASVTANNEQAIILSYAAGVSHELRKRGQPDPIEQSEQSCRLFMEWIESRLLELETLRTRRTWQSIRRQWYSPEASGLLRGLQLIRSLIRSRYALGALRQKLLGTHLAARLAGEWTRTSMTNAESSLENTDR